MNTYTPPPSAGAAKGFEMGDDDDLFRLLRRLPMVGGTDDGAVTMADLVYEMKLWPFVQHAWLQFDVSAELPGRIMHLSRIYSQAEAEMEHLTGERRRTLRVIDMDALMEIYATEVLCHSSQRCRARLQMQSCNLICI